MAQTPIPHPAQQEATAQKRALPGRLLYIDNLRWVMIMLVVSMHAAVTYSHLGSWYFMENRTVTFAESAVFATYQATLQSFFMGFLFFIAGYFVPGAFDKKGAGKFLRDRGFRLGLPLLLYVFVIHPVAVYCISLFHGEDVYPEGFASGYAHYIRSGRFLSGTGPLWFCEALLLFCLAYAGWRILFRRTKASGEVKKAIPGRLQIWGFIALIAVCTFLVRFPWPNGTSFYNLQFCYFSQYVFFFIAGTLAYRDSWLTRFPAASRKYWRRVALIAGPALWVILLALGGASKGDVSPYQGGMHWQSLGMAFWESMLGVAISLYLLGLFRERFNSQGKWARYFSANAFAVFVFHAPILIALSRMISPVHAPLLLMFLLLTLGSILVTFALCSLVFRRIPLLKKIL